MADASYPDELLYHPEHDWVRLDGDTATLLGGTQRNRFILNERVVVNGFFGLPHEWEQSTAGESQAAHTCEAAA